MTTRPYSFILFIFFVVLFVTATSLDNSFTTLDEHVIRMRTLRSSPRRRSSILNTSEISLLGNKIQFYPKLQKRRGNRDNEGIIFYISALKCDPS